jgi:hypothetical protein
MTASSITASALDENAIWRAYLNFVDRFCSAPARVRPPDGLRTPAEAARKRRRTSLGTLLKQAAKAGKSVKGAEVYPDRTVLQFGEPEPTDASNPWPLDEFRTKETKQ